MRRIERSVLIDRTVDVVFGFVADLAANGQRWVAGAPIFEREGSGTIGVGTTYRYEGRFMGRHFVRTRTYTAFEPNSLIVVSNGGGLGGMPVDQRLRFQAAGSATKVTFAVEWGRLPGLYPILEPVIAAIGGRMLPGALARLKAALEKPEPSPR